MNHKAVMTNNELSDYKAALSNLKRELEIELSEQKKAAKPVPPDSAIGRISRMDAINNKTMADRAVREIKQKLSRIDRIEQAIEDGKAGLCIHCHKEIQFERLMFMPATRICISCARKR